MSDDAEKAITDAIEAGTPIMNLALQMPLTLTLGPKGTLNIDSAIAVRRVLQSYNSYYNATRTHLDLRKDPPDRRPVERGGRIVACETLGGLHCRYSRI